MAKRQDWEFEYSAADLVAAADKQCAFRLERVKWWELKKAEVMAEIKDSGIEVSESVAAGSPGYGSKMLHGPRVMVRNDLQEKLSECHDKIQHHQHAADEYQAWADLLNKHSSERLKLTQSDWTYFFGKPQ
jgi:hypothetical protein